MQPFTSFFLTIASYRIRMEGYKVRSQWLFPLSWVYIAQFWLFPLSWNLYLVILTILTFFTQYILHFWLFSQIASYRIRIAGYKDRSQWLFPQEFISHSTDFLSTKSLYLTTLTFSQLRIYISQFCHSRNSDFFSQLRVYTLQFWQYVEVPHFS